MLLTLIVALVVIPLLELWVFLEVGSWIGYFPTILLLIAISISGGYLVKRQGLGAWRRAQAQLRAGEIPAAEFVDGTVILAAGALLMTPGFVTDALGLLLLISPLRLLPRRWVRNHTATRTGNAVYGRVINVRNTATSPPTDPGRPPPGTTSVPAPVIETPDPRPGQ